MTTIDGFLKVEYSCDGGGGSMEGQLKLVQNLCQGMEQCRVAASRDIFGHAACEGTCDAEMHLRIVFSCNGGFDESITEAPACGLCTTTTTTTPGYCLDLLTPDV